jgi:hypothetical protein
MRDYIKVWTSILYDADPVPTGQTRAGFFQMGGLRDNSQPPEAQDWIDLYTAVGGYTDPELMLNEPRWYGWDVKALIADLNTAYFVGLNTSLFVDGTQGSYAPRTGQIDIFKSSPFGTGYNSVTAEKKGHGITEKGNVIIPPAVQNVVQNLLKLAQTLLHSRKLNEQRAGNIINYELAQTFAGLITITQALIAIDKILATL